MKATRLLHDEGQSLWLDNITRTLLDSGALQGYIDDLSITGLTSNPTIFDHAIRNSAAYDSAIAEKVQRGIPREALFFELALEDLSRAAELFRPVHEKTNGVDGWVSLEVSPLLANDPLGTLAAAKELLDRAPSNLFIKIPGTKQGLAAIEEAIFAGVPVNVTLLFSREQYLAAADAFLRGIERRIDAGLNPLVASVASVFISRWDVAVAEKVPEDLRNQLGIAIAKRVYKAAEATLLSSPLWQRVYNLGGRPQRLLWASTGTKDPKASDILYVKALAAPFTVALPCARGTLKSLATHTELGDLLPPDGGNCEEVLTRLLGGRQRSSALAEQLRR